MKQLILSEKAEEGKEICLIDRDYHYLYHVLRKRVGDSLDAVDNKGNRCCLTIKEISSEFCRVILSDIISTKSNQLEIDLYICLPKGKKLDLIIRQGTEVGISRIHPLYSHYSLVQFKSGKDINSKKERWNKIIREARQQSGSLIETKIEEPASLRNMKIGQCDNELFLFMHQEKIEENHKIHQNQYSKVSYLIGPEGGLADEEVAFLQESGALPFYFGNNVLRTETASLYGAAYIKSLFQEN